MKTTTILKTFGYFIGWMVTFQFFDEGFELMNQPSSFKFNVGVGLVILVVFSLSWFGSKLYKMGGELHQEYSESKNKQENK
jgi:hypothetical protein